MSSIPRRKSDRQSKKDGARSFTVQSSIVPTHYVTDELNESHRTRHIIHTRIERHQSETRSSDKDMRNSQEVRKTKSMSVTKINRKESLQKRNNSSTTTTTDVNTRLTQKDSFSTHVSEQRIEVNIVVCLFI